ncbi:hypothetical protein L6452_05691 [Arctium lappa]|uniref:Uncharacterized protein n=1 Tax=Arctium lappa TaxID=4217 RepID=A0ACB9EGM6_ARCLA|nr:hypothetical protein L6452_05691 [Arctium lappa]
MLTIRTTIERKGECRRRFEVAYMNELRVACQNGELSGGFRDSCEYMEPRCVQQYAMSLNAFQPLSSVAGVAKRAGLVFYGRQSPGGHNVVWGLCEALKVHNPKSTLLRFLGGYDLILTSIFVKRNHRARVVEILVKDLKVNNCLLSYFPSFGVLLTICLILKQHWIKDEKYSTRVKDEHVFLFCIGQQSHWTSHQTLHWCNLSGLYGMTKEGQVVKLSNGERLDLLVIGAIEGAVQEGTGSKGLSKRFEILSIVDLVGLYKSEPIERL